MPQVIPLFVAAIGITGTAATIVTGVISIGLSIGLAYLATALFAPKQPKPEDVQTSLKQATAARVRHYGRVKISGIWIFGDTYQGSLYKVLALGTGELDAIEQYWIDDKQVTVDPSTGLVTTSPYLAFCTIQTKLGLPTEPPGFPAMTPFPEFNDGFHRGDGVSQLFAIQYAATQETVQKVFPQLAQTLYRVVARASKVYIPSTGATQWSDNAAAVIRDFMTHPDGMRLPATLFTTPQAAAGWIAAYNRCNEAVALLAGGTEPRYRLWGSYRLDERPADVLARMLTCCDGRIVPTPDGGVTLDIGAWAEPSVVIDQDAITGFTELSRGRDVMTTANVITATYLSPDPDYLATDADRWDDEDDIALRGEIVQDIQLNMAPSHSQARRLMKLAAYRAKPNWVGTFQCNLKAAAAFGQRLVRITYPLFELDEVFELLDFRWNVADGGILLGITLQVQSLPPAAYDWTPDQEGTEPAFEASSSDDTIPVPTGFAFLQDAIMTGGVPVSVGVITFDAPPDGLEVEGRAKRASVAQWSAIPISPGQTAAQTGVLAEGVEYEAQVRHVSNTDRPGDWTPSDTLTPVADSVAPAVVTGVSATGGVGTVSLAWTTPNSPNYVGANIRRNTVSTEGTAVLVRTEYGSPSSADTWQDTGLAAGTYYYWIKARNGSGVESASVATSAVTVT